MHTSAAARIGGGEGGIKNGPGPKTRAVRICLTFYTLIDPTLVCPGNAEVPQSVQSEFALCAELGGAGFGDDRRQANHRVNSTNRAHSPLSNGLGFEVY